MPTRFDDVPRTVTQVPPSPDGYGLTPAFEIPAETVAASADQQKVSAGLSKSPHTDLIVNRYLLGEEIGRGGMGIVYFAKDLRLNRDVAVKLLLDRFPVLSLIATRFVDEARITAQLQHPGIAPVHDLGTLPDGRPFLAMKLIKGKTLSALLKNNPAISPTPQSGGGSEATPFPSGLGVTSSGPARPARNGPGGYGGSYLDTFSEICQTVAYAHNKGVIHRDLKPANVMVGTFGEVQVMDWGLAKVLRNADVGVRNDAAHAEEHSDGRSLIESDRTPDSETLAGSVLGTPAYMPPEQAKGEVERVDARADVFALGAILCELLTGDPPYTGSFEEIRAHSILGDVRPALDRLAASGADPDLIALAADCLAPVPANRLTDAGVVVARLTAYRTGVSDRLRRSEQDRAAAEVRVLEQVKRRRVWLALAALMVVGTATSVVFAIKSAANANTARIATGVAKDEAERVRDAHRELQSQKERAEKQLTRAEWLVYANSIDDAHRYLNEGRGDLAAEELNGCRIDYRGWEHDYLFSRLHEHAVCLSGHTGAVTGVAASRDGRTIVSGSDDGTVRVWDAGEGTCRLTLTGHTAAVTCVAISPDGKRIASGSSDETLRVWDAATGTLLHECEGGRGTVACVAFSPDGQWLASGTWVASVLVYPVASARVRFELKGHRSGVTCVAFSPDSRRIVSGSLDAGMRLWDARTGTGLEEWRGHANAVTCVAFSPDGARIASGSRDRTVRIWDGAAPTSSLVSLPHPGDVASCEFGPDGTSLVTGSQDTTVRSWDVVTGELLRERRGHTGGVTGVTHGPDGFRIITGSKDHSVRVWDAEPPEPALPWPGFEIAPTVRATSPDGRWAVGRSGPRSLSVTKPGTNEKLALFKGHADGVTSVNVRPDGTRLVTASAGREVYLWETTTWTCVAELKGQGEGVYYAGFSPDGKTIASGANESSLLVWHAPLRQPEVVLESNLGSLAGVAFGPDGTRVYARNAKGATFAWVASTGQPAADSDSPPDFPDADEAWSPDRSSRVRIVGDRVVLRDMAKWSAFDAEMKRRLRVRPRAHPEWYAKRASESESERNNFATRFFLRYYVRQVPADFNAVVRLAEVEARMAKGK